MSPHYPALIIVLPLLAAFLIAAAGWLKRKYCFSIAAGALAFSLYCSVKLLQQVLTEGDIVYRMGGWPPPWGIAYSIDHLNAAVLVMIAAVALVNLIAARPLVLRDFPDRLGSFYTLYVLFVMGLMGMVATGDAFNLYVLLEISSLTGYALIGMGPGRAPLATLKYILIGTVGASLYLLGIGYLYMMTGSLNMADIARILPPIYDSRVVLSAFVICLTGLSIKMAFFPLHSWLPGAYAFAPSASASLIAPLMTKVMIYVMIRLMLSVFSPAYVFDSLAIGDVMVGLAVIAIVMGALLALAAQDLKKMLTYVIVAEVGYMVGGAWLGNRAGMTGAVLHILNDALMTLCVFLAAGNLAYRLDGCGFQRLYGAFRSMPGTMAAFAAGALSIIGVPPTCGFFSKWYLISGGVAAGAYLFVGALIFSSLINVVLFFRVFEIAYFKPPEAVHPVGGEGAAAAEVPLEMLLPLMAVAAGLLALGLATGPLVTHLINLAIPAAVL